MSLDKVSEIVWKNCFSAKKGEKALIVADKAKENIARSLERTGKNFCNCELVFIKETPRPGAEPEDWAAKRMLGNDIIVCPTKMSLTHTMAVINAKKSGARVITMPDITEDIYLRCVAVDYKKMKEETDRIGDMIRGKNLTVTARGGTDMFMSLGNRKVDSWCGIPRPGETSNIPDGETGGAPLEGKSEGKIVVDTVKNPFTITVEKGEMADCTNDEVWKLHDVENGRNLAEFAIGTNPKARIVGNILEDEKVKGTAHIAFGTNKSMGGLIQSSVHMDYVFWKPTIMANNKILIKEGKVL